MLRSSRRGRVCLSPRHPLSQIIGKDFVFEVTRSSVTLRRVVCAQKAGLCFLTDLQTCEGASLLLLRWGVLLLEHLSAMLAPLLSPHGCREALWQEDVWTCAQAVVWLS